MGRQKFSMNMTAKKTASVASKKLMKKFAHRVKAFCMTRMLEYVMDRLLNRPTTIEHQVASRIAKTIDPHKNDTTDDPLVRIRLKKLFDSNQNLIIHYIHEAQLATYKKHIHQ